jgi:hypothetical protein
MAWIRVQRFVVAAICGAAVLLATGAARAASPSGDDAAKIPGIEGGPPLVKGETPEETYQLNFVGLEHFESGGYRGQTGWVAKTETWWGFRGKYKVKLGPIEFYDAVAQPDLHSKAVSRVVLTSSFLVAGVALGVGGAIYTFSQADNTGGPPKTGIYAIMGGAALIFVAVQLRFEIASEPEAYKMARVYNDRLRAHLGLPPIVEDPTLPHASSPRARPPQRRIGFAPSVAPDGGGLLVIGSF